MNWDQMRRTWLSVQLVPIACRIDQDGRELQQIDDDWVIERVTDAGVRISSVSWIM